MVKSIFVKDLAQSEKGLEFTDFFMARNISIKTDARGKAYLDLFLSDKTGEITAKKWDVSDSEQQSIAAINEKDIVKVKGILNEWQGQMQGKILKIRKADTTNADDIYDIADFVKAAPEPAEEMYDYIHGVAEGLKDDDLRRLCVKVLDDSREKLMYYPAASKNHHAERSGLLYHTKRMLMHGICVCDVYTELNRDLVCAGVILHDIEKLTEIEAGADGIATGYSFEGQMLGHIVQGVKLIDKLTLELDFPREKAIMLEHMILSHHYEPEYGSPRRPVFPEAEVLHYLDILDARLFDMNAALELTQPGEWSEKIWTLENRKVYKPAE